MLPEDEERQLQEIEQALCRDDPKFGRRMCASDPRLCYARNLIQALAGIVVGVGLLSAGAVTNRVGLETAGVAIVLLSLVWAVARWRWYAARTRPVHSRAATKTANGTKRPLGQSRRARMVKRMEERWRRRQEGNGGSPGRNRS